MNLNNNFKSYKFWTALSAAVVILCEAVGKAFGLIPDGILINNIIMGICGILVVFGIVKRDVPKSDTEVTRVDDDRDISDSEEPQKEVATTENQIEKEGQNKTKE